MAGPDLLARLNVETDELVRMYIVNALIAIDFGGDHTVSNLKQRFDSLDATNVPLNADHSYSDVDEKIVVASALYVFDKEPNKSQHLAFITEWLKPPTDTLKADLREGYSQRRLTAVGSLENMPGAIEAIPLLEAMLSEPNAESWTKAHVPRVIEKLRSR